MYNVLKLKKFLKSYNEPTIIIYDFNSIISSKDNFIVNFFNIFRCKVNRPVFNFIIFFSGNKKYNVLIRLWCLIHKLPLDKIINLTYTTDNPTTLFTERLKILEYMCLNFKGLIFYYCADRQMVDELNEKIPVVHMIHM